MTQKYKVKSEYRALFDYNEVDAVLVDDANKNHIIVKHSHLYDCRNMIGKYVFVRHGITFTINKNEFEVIFELVEPTEPKPSSISVIKRLLDSRDANRKGEKGGIEVIGRFYYVDDKLVFINEETDKPTKLDAIVLKSNNDDLREELKRKDIAFNNLKTNLEKQIADLNKELENTKILTASINGLYCASCIENTKLENKLSEKSMMCDFLLKAIKL